MTTDDRKPQQGKDFLKNLSIKKQEDKTAKRKVTSQNAESESMDWASALSHLKEVEDWNLSFVGRKGYNPFFFIRDSIKPLRRRYEDGDRSRELYRLMVSLPKLEPRIDSIYDSGF